MWKLGLDSVNNEGNFYLENKVLFRLYITFNGRDVIVTPQLDLYSYVLRTVYYSIMSSNNEGQFSWRTKCLFICISPCVLSVPVELHTTLILRMRYKHCKFG
jgi:hypothetical protein